MWYCLLHLARGIELKIRLSADGLTLPAIGFAMTEAPEMGMQLLP